MKVLFVSHSCSTPINLKLIDEIAQTKKAKLMLLTVPWWLKGKKLENKNYEIVIGKTFFGPHIFRFFFFPPLIGKIKKFAPDIINLDEEPGSLIALQAVFWKKLTGAKLVFKSCENIYRFGRKPLPWIEKLVLKNSDYAIALNEEVSEVLRKKGFKKKIKVIGLGLDEKDFKIKEQTELKKKLGLDSYTIAYFGRLVREKSVETLLEAAAKLEFEFKLLIDSWMVDDLYKKELLGLAEKTGLKEKIVFIKPKHEEVQDYFNCIDLLVVPSKTTQGWKEQFGKVAIEAMILEKPVIVSDSGNLPKLVVNKEQIFEEQNSFDLAEKIRFFYQNKGLVEGIVKNGRKKVEKNFLWKNIAFETLKVFEEIEKENH